MVSKSFAWSMARFLLPLLVRLGLFAAGVYCYFQSVPPAAARPGNIPPANVDVDAAFPGASAEEVERQVTIPLEVTFAGAPGLRHIRSKSLPGLAELRLEFETRVGYEKARQEVINRLAIISQPLPPGVIPTLSPPAAGYEVLRYILRGPRGGRGKDLYTPADLRALQDWVVQREFRRVPRVIDVVSAGGAVTRYEIHVDPDRLRRYGLTLRQLQTALAESNDNGGGDVERRGNGGLAVRAVGLFGGGMDPVQKVLGLKDAAEAAARLRAEEQRRLREIRSLVIATVKGAPVRLEDVVEGGRLAPGEEVGRKGVVVGRRPGQGRVGLALPGEPDEEDRVVGVVLMRPGEDRQATLGGVKAKFKELNDTPGRLLPGVRLEPLWERAGESAEDILVLQARFPANASAARVSEVLRQARVLLLRRPGVRGVLSVAGPVEGGLDPAGADSARVLVLLHPGNGRARDRRENDAQSELSYSLPDIEWDFLPDGVDDFQAAFVATPGAGLLKIVGPDLEELERLAARAQAALRRVEGVPGVHVRRVLGKSDLTFRVDLDKCRRWGVSAADVNNVVALVVGGRRATQMIEGERIFDITLLWPEARRRNEESILDIPVDVTNDKLAPAEPPGKDPAAPLAAVPRLRLCDLVSPVGADGHPDPKGAFVRPGVAAIWREQGKRLIAVRFRIRGRKEADVVAEAEKALAPLFKAPYRAEWSAGGR